MDKNFKVHLKYLELTTIEKVMEDCSHILRIFIQETYGIVIQESLYVYGLTNLKQQEYIIYYTLCIHV